MSYKILSVFFLSIICSESFAVNISGLLSDSDLGKNIASSPAKKKPRISLSGQLSQADLSKIVENKVTRKDMIRLSGLLSMSQLDAVINFMYAKQQQSKSISGLISQKDLDASIVWKTKKMKPRVNLSGLMTQNYLDPDYQAAFKILNNPQLEQEYNAQLENIQTYFKQYYLSETSSVSPKQVIMQLPKICCPDQNEEYTLCQTEQ